MTLPDSIDACLELLKGQNYVTDRSLATTLYLALKLERPLFLEGEAGVGKTEIGKVLAQGLGRRLVRLQCYEDKVSRSWWVEYGSPNTRGTSPHCRGAKTALG